MSPAAPNPAALHPEALADPAALTAALTAALGRPRRILGQFAIIDDGAATLVAPLALAPARLSGLEARVVGVEGPALGRAGRLRLATALRQDLWRRLRRARGVAPVVAVRATGGRIVALVAVAALDAAPLPPDAMRALAAAGDGIGRWTRWAARAPDTRKDDTREDDTREDDTRHDLAAPSRGAEKGHAAPGAARAIGED